MKAPAPTPLNRLLEKYEAFLVQERSLCAKVVHTYRTRARRFLETTLPDQALDFGLLTMADVSSYILGEVQTSRGGGAKNKIAALRSLLRYLYVHGELERDLSGAVPSAAVWRLAGLPKFLTPDDTARLLGSQDRRTLIGCRAHAVLLLLVRLGLRAAEVANLTLDDIYWSQGELLVRGKGGRQDRLPLPQEVGEAIVSYLQRARPHSNSRRLFLNSRALHGPITGNAVSEIVRAAGERSGIAGLRAHRLRHTAATHMLWNGASLPEIGQALRQEGVDTPAIYAKVDRNGLRTICRPWPGAIS
ncbi:MAG: tyrosine-type recombinase/integrase [Elusimicrobia bacterium]|nr:tyrosine-type recombinase/integrase [Elusimicrobiota bacterium]